MNSSMNDKPDELVRAVEATLFASEEPMTVEALAGHLGDAAIVDIRDAVQSLAEHYAGRGIALVERGKKWHFQTAADLAHLLRREREQVRRLSRAATEVLAIIGYHEPVSRAEIESIRGVQTAKGTLDVLMEAGWVRVAGRREVPGRPVIYATTPEFLQHFGLSSRRDLPGIDELRAAGLLDPVDDAYEALTGMPDDEAVSDGEAASDGGAELEFFPDENSIKRNSGETDSEQGEDEGGTILQTGLAPEKNGVSTDSTRNSGNGAT